MIVSVRCSGKGGCRVTRGYSFPVCCVVSTYICVPPAQCLAGTVRPAVCATRSLRGGAAHLVKSCPYYSLTDLNIVK